MDNLSPEHIHLLLDEPIYILPDHGDHPLESVVEEERPTYSGENNLGICIFLSDSNEEDISFLFKGLNALEIQKEDVALFNTDYDPLQDYPEHLKRLTFSGSIKVDEAFTVRHIEELTTLESLPLQEVRNSQDFKRQFWESLKVVFKKV